MQQSNPNSSQYNACIIDLIERIDAGRFSGLDEIQALANNMPEAWRSHLINDALEAIANR